MDSDLLKRFADEFGIYVFQKSEFEEKFGRDVEEASRDVDIGYCVRKAVIDAGYVVLTNEEFNKQIVAVRKVWLAICVKDTDFDISAHKSYEDAYELVYGKYINPIWTRDFDEKYGKVSSIPTKAEVLDIANVHGPYQKLIIKGLEVT